MATQILTDRAEAATRTRKLNKVKINVFLDLLLTVIFMVEMEEHFTGLPLHEILGLLFAAAFSLHILLHWDWIVNVTRTFFRKLIHESRLNYVLNVALFADMLFVTVSGILISRTIGLNLQLSESLEGILRPVHMIGAELVLILVAAHVALHWKWIMTNGGKYLFGWIPKVGSK
ncbi:MAG: DUF4405 domain-containing protein [Anaerolineae bacterium]|nr:DUF4405 domain-containing protein [Anaerolineae bacterium]